MKKKIHFVQVESVREVSPGTDFFELVLIGSKKWQVKPGQFFCLPVGVVSSVMPRPISAFRVTGNRLSQLFKAVGPNTRAYSRLAPGTKLIITGPQGNPIPMNEEWLSYILVAGGIGVAGFGLFTKQLLKEEKDFKLLVGVKTAPELALTSYFHDQGIDVQTIIESNQNGGKVTKLLAKALKNDHGRSTIVACGPIPMLYAVNKLAESYHNECVALMEKVMACRGTGSCLGCTMPLEKGEHDQVCQGGAAFYSRKVDWQLLLKQTSQPPKVVSSPDVTEPMLTILKGQAGRILELKYPLMIAAGCLGSSNDTMESFDLSRAGAIITKGLSLELMAGNPGDRICETEAGMLNAIGLENVGVEDFIKYVLPELAKLGLPIIVNIYGKTVEDFGELAARLEPTSITGIENNVSCPNKKQGGMAFGVNPDLTGQIVALVREKAPSKFIITKLTPAAIYNMVDIARAAVKSGSDAISAINTIPAAAIDIETRRSKLGNIFGGLSGPGIKPVAVGCVIKLYEANLGVPIIGVGGISNHKDALEFFIGGSNAIEVGTGAFTNPLVLTDIHDGLLKKMKKHGAGNVQDMVGTRVV